MGKKKKGDLKPENLEELAMIVEEGDDSLKEATGFGSAPNLDQDEFDKTQENLSDEQLEDQVSGLVALFRRKQEERRQREGPVSEYAPNDGEIETE